MTNAPRITVALLLASALGGCGLLDATADSKHLCVQQTNVANVPAAPPVSVPITPLTTVRLDMSAAITDPAKSGVELHVFPDAMSLGSASGDVNFAGIETVTMTVLPPAGRTDLQPVVFRYQRPASAPAQVLVVEAHPDAGVDLAPYLDNKALNIAVSASGVAPARAWTATLEMCGEVRVKVNYWDQITS